MTDRPNENLSWGDFKNSLTTAFSGTQTLVGYSVSNTYFNGPASYLPSVQGRQSFVDNALAARNYETIANAASQNSAVSVVAKIGAAAAKSSVLLDAADAGFYVYQNPNDGGVAGAATDLAVGAGVTVGAGLATFAVVSNPAGWVVGGVGLFAGTVYSIFYSDSVRDGVRDYVNNPTNGGALRNPTIDVHRGYADRYGSGSGPATTINPNYSPIDDARINGKQIGGTTASDMLRAMMRNPDFSPALGPNPFEDRGGPSGLNRTGFTGDL